MEFFKPGVRYNFLGAAKPLVTMSLVLVLASWALVFTKGLNFGIDFAGGTEVLLAFDAPQDVSALREKTTEVFGEEPEVVTYGLTDEGRYFVRSRVQGLLTADEVTALRAAIVAELGEPELWDASDEAGEEVRVKFAETTAETRDKLKAALTAANQAEGVVSTQTQAQNPVYILRIPGVRQQMNNAMKAAYGEAYKGIDRLESVGSAVGKQMRNQGALAVLYALLAILLYISFRFDLRYSPGAVLALVHDVSITLGIFAITGMEFNLPIIAALLAIVGYSLNDTIVVYDRIRESIDMGLGKNLVENINISISDCLSRTVLTSVTTFLAVLSIYLFGGGIIQNFAFAMLIGVVVGTYSSMYVASPAVVAMDRYLSQRRADAAAAAKLTAET